MLNSRDRRLLRTVLGGRSDANIRFAELRRLLRNLGFDERTKGSHHIFTRVGVVDILNLQERRSMAKEFQVRQIRRLIIYYGLVPDDT